MVLSWTGCALNRSMPLTPLQFVVRDPRVARWAAQPKAALQNTWLHGYWKFDWADNHVRIAYASSTQGSNASDWVITVDSSTPPVYSFEAKARFYAENLQCELDAPGEYFIDTERKMLLFYVPNNRSFLQYASAVLSVQSTPLISATGVSNVRVQNLRMMFSRIGGISVTTANNLIVADCEVSNMGNYGVVMNNVLNSSMERVIGAGYGCRGAAISGGSVRTLASANSRITDCSFSRFGRYTRSYTPGIQFSGVGITIARNRVGNGPHEGISGSGNNMHITQNDFHNLCFGSRDASAFYVGRSWAQRGLVVDGNTFENVSALEPTGLGASLVQAMYLDDQFSGVQLTNNVCRHSQNCFLIGGGRDNWVANNTCSDVEYCVQFDNRGMGWQNDTCSFGKDGTPGLLIRELMSLNYTQPPYSTAYPQLPGILQDYPCWPVNNTFIDNTYCRVKSGKFINRDIIVILLWRSVAYNNTEYCT